jgi:GNAT superfamily N-acetyltransferase
MCDNRIMMRSPIAIGPLSPPDRSRWAELWAEYQRFYGIDLPPEVTDSTWERLQNGRVHGFGARDSSGALVGIVHYLFHEDTWSTSAACYLQDLYVDPRVRGSGYGRQLIQAVAQAAARAGAGNPYWLTHESNAVGRQLYDRLGKNHGFIQYSYLDAAE